MTDQTTNRPPKRYDYIFGLHLGHLDDALTAPFCQYYGVEHVNYTDPHGHHSGWWISNEGEETDWAQWVANQVMIEIGMTGGMDRFKVSPR